MAGRMPEDLVWWADPTRVFSASFEELPYTTTLTTDASLEGWGVLWNGQEVHGAWENDKRRIDELELRAVLQALETMPIASDGQRILLRCDNTTAVAYLNNMGGQNFSSEPGSSRHLAFIGVRRRSHESGVHPNR